MKSITLEIGDQFRFEMAMTIATSEVTPRQWELIRKMLVLKPKIFNPLQPVNTDPFDFYLIRNGILYLPLMFGSSLLGVIPNSQVDFPPVAIDFTGALRDYQIPVADQAWNELQHRGAFTLGLYPGFGKTILGANIAARAKLLTTILVHREILAIQWKTTFETVTNTQVWIVGETAPPKFGAIICMNARWKLIPESLRKEVGLLIIDEAHSFCTRGKVDCLLAFEPKYVLIETATLKREDGLHDMMYAIAGNQGIDIQSQKGFTVVKVNTAVEVQRKFTRQGKLDWHSLLREVLFVPRRNWLITDIVKSHRQDNILILTRIVAHVNHLQKLLTGAGIPCDILCGAKKTYQDTPVLIGTISKIGTGFDPATSCADYNGKPFNILILASTVKKTSLLVQNVGRVFRSAAPTVYHLVDRDPIFDKHWRSSFSWYKSRGGSVVEYNAPS